MTRFLKLTTLAALLAGATLGLPSRSLADRDRESDRHQSSEQERNSDSSNSRRDSSNRSRDNDSRHQRAVLTGAGSSLSARGTAEVETKSNGSRELDIKVSRLNVPAGASVSVTMNGFALGNARVSRGRMEFKSRSASIPAATSGTTVVIRTVDGTTVASGKF